MQKVIDTAHAFGWKVAHFRPALTKHGWRTAVSGDGKGFPDTVLTHPEGGTVFRELKRDATKCDADQEAWGKALVASGADYGVWRPRDWNAVLFFLSLGRAGIPPSSDGNSSDLGADRRGRSKDMDQSQGNQQGQPGQDSQGRQPGEPDYDATTDPGSPQYDAVKAQQRMGQSQGTGQSQDQSQNR